MSDPQSDFQADQTPPELTPEAKAMLARARRSFGVSIGVLLLGFMAIGVAIVYRATRDAPVSSTISAAYPIETLSVPAGAQVISASAAAGTVTVTYRLGTLTQIAIFDGKTGELVHNIAVNED